MAPRKSQPLVKRLSEIEAWLRGDGRKVIARDVAEAIRIINKLDPHGLAQKSEQK